LKNSILHILFLSISSVSAFAQAHDHDHNHGDHDSTTLAKDTARVVFCYANDHTPRPNDTFVLTAYRFNPLAKQAVPYAFLGNIGSPYTQLMYAPQVHSGLDLGLHQYDLYQPDHDAIRFYDAKRAFSEAFYTQAGNQEQSTLFTKVARSFGSHWSASFRYDIFNQKGVYQWQRPRHTHVSLGLRYRSTNDRYQVFISGIDNTAKMQQGGGYNINNGASGGLSAAIPAFNEAIDTQQRVSIQIAQFLKISKGFEVAHTARYGYERHVFWDKKRNSTFYKFAADPENGVLYFIENKRLSNTFLLQSPTDSVKKIRWAAGVRHAIWWTYQAPLDTTYQNLFALGNVEIQPFHALKVSADGGFGLAFRNAADYHINAKANLDLGKIGQLEGFLLSQRYAPTLLQNLMTVNDKTAWKNNFLPTYENSFGAMYGIKLPFVRFKGGIENHTIANYIYNDTLQRAAQANAALNIAQIKLNADLKFKNFHLDNRIILQTMNRKDYLAMPNLWSQHSLYWQGKLFKEKLNLRGGFDAVFTDAYYAQGYNPLSGQFYVQNKEKLSFYPQIDAHVNFTIDKFNGFLLYENLYSAFSGDAYYAAPNYPMRSANFRFGVLWRFLD
jgi:Putative porin